MTDPAATPRPHTPDYEVRAVGAAETPFVIATWSQAHMRAPGQPHGALYKKHVRPTIIELLNRGDVWINGAFGDFDGRPDSILGWLAWTPGPLPAIHFAYVRGPLRMRGIFGALLKDAMVGHRLIHTFRGSLPKYGRKNAPSYDRKVVAALANRGTYVTYVPHDEWLERMK